MKIARMMLFTLSLFVIAAAVCFAAHDAQMGTWKLNEANSKITPGMGMNNTVVYEAAGDQIKVIVDGVDKDGKATHNEWIGKFDGKDYPVTGDTTSDARSYKMVDDHTLALTIKKEGKITLNGKIVVSPDGKTRIVTVKGTDLTGKKFENVSAYDKQ